MKRESLPITSIIVKDRQRLDLGDIESLAESLRVYGLIQPIVLNQDHQLIAGRRRLEAATRLGWQSIDVVYRETMSPAELGCLELEEDIRRKDRTWQERVIAIAQVHALKSRENALEGKAWTQRATGEMLGVSVGNINYALKIAEWLRDPNHEAWKCDGINDAWRRCYLRPQEDAALAELARRSQALASPPSNELPQDYLSLPDLLADVSSPPPDDLAAERERYYSNPHNPPDSFDAYWAERCAQRAAEASTIHLSRRLVCGDSIAWMTSHPSAVDHIITDIPYGIDMDNLEQSGTGMTSIDLVREEHDVEYNLDLIAQFFPAAFRCVRDNGFVATCCDQSLWATMSHWAEDAGFRVQRWPVTWVKTNPCSNQAAAYNTTKDTEIVMLCAKPGATLAQHVGTSVVMADNREAVASTGHPFAKPFELTRFLVDAVSIPRQTILDPFAGRGSMVLEFIRSERHFFAVELNVAHFNALMENVKQHYLKLNPSFQFA